MKTAQEVPSSSQKKLDNILNEMKYDFDEIKLVRSSRSADTKKGDFFVFFI